MDNPGVTYSQVLCALADGAVGVSFACILGFTSTALLSMASDPNFDITEEQGSWIGAIVPGLALVGSLLAGQILEKLGRKKTLWITTLPMILAWLLIAYARTPLEVIVARAISGLFLGIQQVAISVFVSETVHPKLQAKFTIIPGLTTMTGFIAINVIGTISGWRAMAYAGLAADVLLVLLFSCLPETPYFLLKLEKPKQSLATLKWLRSTDREAEKEFKELSQTISSGGKNKEEAGLADMIKPPYRWPFSTAVLLHIFQQTAGVGAITSFMGLIFERAGSAVDPNIATITMTVLNMISIFIVGSYFGKYPRKTFINVSSFFMVNSLLIFAAYMYVKEETGFELPYIFGYIPFIIISTYMLGFSFGWAPLPWMFIRDSLPVKIRGSGSGIAVATNWGLSFVVTKSFSWGTFSLGHHYVYLSYAVSTLVGTIVMNYYIPETFGFNESQLEKYYRDSYKKKTR